MEYQPSTLRVEGGVIHTIHDKTLSLSQIRTLQRSFFPIPPPPPLTNLYPSHETPSLILEKHARASIATRIPICHGGNLKLLLSPRPILSVGALRPFSIVPPKEKKRKTGRTKPAKDSGRERGFLVRGELGPGLSFPAGGKVKGVEKLPRCGNE